MGVMVALLRGVNVGGRTKLAMAALRDAATTAGFADVATYVQSGNVVFRSAVSPATAARRLTAALRDGAGIETEVIVRTGGELAAVIERNPFAAHRPGPTQLHVVFSSAPAAPGLVGVDLDGFHPEEAIAIGKELYLYLPNGMGRSKLAAALSRRGGPAGTARNWRTVTTLSRMAGELAAR